jgi:plasmid replication initiation protein
LYLSYNLKKGAILKTIIISEHTEVKKADVIIEARYKLNPLALKFITTLISGIKRTDKENQEYIFSVKDFQELTGTKRKDIYVAIKLALKELLDKPLYIKTDKGFIMCNWISGGQYMENEGKVIFMIYPKLKPYLLEAKEKFLKYKLKNILSLKSSYSIRLFEMLKDASELEKRYGKISCQKSIPLEDLRNMLDVPESYRYNNIKTQILEKAKEDLKEYTDISFTYKEEKESRKVSNIIFTIYPKQEETKKDFINLIRSKYKGKGFFAFGKDENNKECFYGIDHKNLLYALCDNEIKKFKPTESLEKYTKIFNLYIKNKLYQELIKEATDFKDLKEKNTELFLKVLKSF